MDEREFFDKMAPTWDDNETVSTPDRINYVLGFLNIKKGERILDLGTGTGVLLPFLSERIGPDGSITAVDYSEGMLGRAIKKFSNLNPKPEFLNIDFENENIEGTFDHIMLFCVYPHLHTPVDTLKWMKAVNLSPNGEIVIAFPTSEDFINNIHREKHSESDILPPAQILAERLKAAGLNAKVLNADSKSYIISITK